MQRTNFYLPSIPTLLWVMFSFISFPLFSQNISNNNGQNKETSRIVSLNLQDIMGNLERAPMENSVAAKSSPLVIALPMPDGSERQFSVVVNDLLAPAFAALQPNLKTYTIKAVNDPTIYGRLTVSPYGVRASIFRKDGLVDIAPLDENNPVLHKSQLSIDDGTGVNCGAAELERFPQKIDIESSALSNGAIKRTFKFAVVTTGEFYQLHKILNADLSENIVSSKAATQAAVAAHINSLEAIYERELAVNFSLLTPIVYTDPNTDPWVPGQPNRLELVAQAIGMTYGPTQYDIGHAIHGVGNGAEWGGGVAQLASLCNNSTIGGFSPGLSKARAWSSMPGSEPLQDLKIIAHEVGHQFSMPHSWNGTCTDPADGNQVGEFDAYEIGSGTTIMSYNLVCWQPNSNIGGGRFPVSDQYFHNISLNRALDHMANNATCGTTSSTGNTPPVVDATTCGATYTLPQGTPFKLTGSGSDADGDPIYYNWEQFDEDGAGHPSQGLIGAAAASSAIPGTPLFRSYPPSTSPTRTFPDMSLVRANDYASNFEPLPTVARALKFRLTGRDLKIGGGGIHYVDVAVAVSAQGPFTVGAMGTVAAGVPINVSWALNGIDFLTNVNIKLSIDGGATFPYTLADGIPAAPQSVSVIIPSGIIPTNTARIMVESADYSCFSFFDMSDDNFMISSDCIALSTLISPEDAVTLPAGDPGLNLGLTNNIGKVVTSFNGFITTGDTQGNLIFLNNTPPVCAGPSNAVYLDTYNFTVDMTGTYVINHGGPSGAILNLYTAPYTGSNCTNHISSNAVRPSGTGGIGANSGLTATLSARVSYVLVVIGFNTSHPVLPFNYNITFPTKPAGANIFDGEIMPANYSYTYLAVNTVNTQVAAVSATSDFTSLVAGTFEIYGANYYSGSGPNPSTVNPASWVGQTKSSLLAGSSCVVFSTNFKSVTITGSACPAPSVGTITQPTCAVATGSVVLNSLPSTGTWTLTRSPGAVTSTGTGTSTTITGLAAGTYTYTVTNAAGCTSSASGNVVINTQPATPSAPSVGTITQTTCAVATGSVVINGLPSTGTWTLTRSPGTITSTGTGTSSTITGLAAGTYTYTVTNAAGCTSSASANVVINTQPATPSAPSVGTITQPVCETPTGSVVLNGLPSTGTWTLTRNPGAVTSTGTGTSTTVSSLAANTYTFTVTNAAGCTSAASANVVINASPCGFTIQSAQTGDWNVGSTWVGGVVPTSADEAIINATHIVTIKATQTKYCKTVAIRTNGNLTIEATATLILDNNSANTTLTNNGTVENSGTITIGATTGVGPYGIVTGGTFNNKSSGIIRIDRTTVASGLFNTFGTFTNEGNITIGATIGSDNTSFYAYGIWNQATFINKASGQIHIDRYSNGIQNYLSSSLTVPDAFFTNEGSITIGANASTGNYGIINYDDFKNKVDGQIRIDNVINNGLTNLLEGVITNDATITIGTNANVGQTAIHNQSTFNNNTGAVINLDKATNFGVGGSGGTFSNAGAVNIGAITAIPTLSTGTTFSNNTGGILRGTGRIAAATFTNNAGTLSPGNSPGLMTFDAAEDFTNSIMKIEVNGSSVAGTDFDQIKVTGAATLGGVLDLTIGYAPSNSPTITIVDAVSLIGTFSSVTPALPVNWEIKYNFPTTGKVSLVYNNPLVKPEINITGNTISILKGDLTPSVADGTDFSTTAIGGAIQKTYTIQNLGDGILNISGITSSNALFVISDAPTTVAANSTATFKVTFSPTALGVQTATITVNNNDDDEGIYDFGVKGEGINAILGAALSVNGGTRQVVVPDNASLDISSAMTIEAWCNWSNLSGYQVIVLKATSGSWSGGYGLSTLNGQLFAHLAGWSYLHQTGYTVPTNQWVHVAATFDGTTSKVYVNGALIATKAVTATIPTNDLSMGIGCDIGVSGYTFSGQLDEVRIWNRALTLSDIQAKMNCEIPGAAVGLVANYHFNQGIAAGNNTTVNTLTDASGFGNNGTLNNYILTGTTANWVAPGGVTSGNRCVVSTTPEINITGKGITFVDGDVTPDVADDTDFGKTTTGSSTKKTYTIQNTGGGALTINGIVSSNALFVVSNAPTTVAAGSTATFDVTFTPTALGIQNATITVNNDDADEGVYDFAVKAEGIEPISGYQTVQNGTWEAASTWLNGMIPPNPILVSDTVKIYHNVTLNSQVVNNGVIEIILSPASLVISSSGQLTNNKEVIALPGVYNAATFPSNSLYYPIYYSGILNNTGKIIVNSFDGGASGRVRFSGGGTINNQSGGLLEIHDVSQFYGTVNNNQGATIRQFTGVQGQTFGTVNNSGLFDIVGGSFSPRNGGIWNNLATGVIENKARIYLGFYIGNLNNTGTVNNRSTGEIFINGETDYYDGTINSPNGHILNEGKIVGVGHFITSASTLSGAGLIYPANSVPSTFSNSNFTPGILDVTGNLSAFGGIQINLLNTTKGTGYGSIAVTGATNVTGTVLQIALQSGFTAQENDEFELLTATNGVTGQFSSTDLPSLSNNLEFRVIYESNKIILRVINVRPQVAASSLNFDATNDYVDLGVWNPFSATGFTQEAWVYANSFGPDDWSNSILLQEGEDGTSTILRAGMNGTNNIRASYHYNGGLYDLDGSMTPNQWHHLAMTWDGTMFSLYIDGNLAQSIPATNPPNRVNSKLWIGNSQISPDRVWDGKIDEVRIWDYALCQSDIRARMNCELVGSETGLMAYYQFNQGFGGGNNTGVTTLNDKTANNHNGTLTNFALNGEGSNWAAAGAVVSGTACNVTPVCLPDYAVTTAGGSLVITDLAGNGETLEVTQNGTNIRFNASGRTYAVNGGTKKTMPVDIPKAGLTSIVINTEGGNDTIKFSNYMTSMPSLTVNGGAGDDQVYSIGGGITFLPNANLDLDLTDDASTGDKDEVVMEPLSNNILSYYSLSGTGTAKVKVSKSVSLGTRCYITTQQGDVTVEGNWAGTTSGNFTGVTVGFLGRSRCEYL